MRIPLRLQKLIRDRILPHTSAFFPSHYLIIPPPFIPLTVAPYLIPIPILQQRLQRIQLTRNLHLIKLHNRLPLLHTTIPRRRRSAIILRRYRSVLLDSRPDLPRDTLTQEILERKRPQRVNWPQVDNGTVLTVELVFLSWSISLEQLIRNRALTTDIFRGGQYRI